MWYSIDRDIFKTESIFCRKDKSIQLDLRSVYLDLYSLLIYTTPPHVPSGFRGRYLAPHFRVRSASISGFFDRSTASKYDQVLVVSCGRNVARAPLINGFTQIRNSDRNCDYFVGC